MKRFFSLVVALMAMQLMFAAKIQVTNTSGDPTVEGSLPWACKTGTSSDTIVFKFSTSGKKVINISTALSPTASIDGSTYSDSIIVDGSLDDGEHVSQGLSSTGTFVKNIVVQNFVTGIRTSKNSNIINCVIRNNTADGVLSQMGESFQNCTIINNGDCGIDNQTGGSAGTISSIENCEISGNKLVGIRAGVAVMKKTSILNNHIGLHALNAGDEISDCVISGNDSIGVYTQYMYDKFSNNIVGLSKDERTPNPNGVGVLTQGGFENFTDNVISGNRKDGIIDNSRQAFGVFKGNYVGTNRYFDVGSEFGNGGNGFVTSNGAYGCIDEFSDNYFGNNREYGLYQESVSTTVTLSNSYFGVTPSGKSMPNGSGGLNFGPTTLTLDKCYISYNEGSGITYKGMNLIVLGGEIAYNRGNGIDYVPFAPRSLEVQDVVFNGNMYSPIYVESPQSMYKHLISNNTFKNTNSIFAIDFENKYPTPQITSCKMNANNVTLQGQVDTAAVAKIELFTTPQYGQTAVTFVDSFYTDADGAFSVSFPKEQFAGNGLLQFTATATYRGLNTSGLSALASPTSDAVIDLTLTAYYVKVDGTGDGSSWEKAMSPQSFAYALPRVGDDVTFYVAEGKYYPMYDQYNRSTRGREAVFTVNSDVSIKGGFSADAKTGAVSDPSKYKTIFCGDFLEDNEIGDDEWNVGRKRLLYQEEDCSSLFLVKPSVKSLDMSSFTYTLDESDTRNYFNMDGVVLRGGGTSIYGVGLDLKITLTNSLVEKAGFIYMYVPNNSLIIDNCKFHQVNRAVLIETGKTKDVLISNTTFDGCCDEFKLCYSEISGPFAHLRLESDTIINSDYFVVEIRGYNVGMNNCKASENNGLYIRFISDTIDVKNSSFDNNNIPYSLFDLQTCISSFDNCSFVKNTGIRTFNNYSPEGEFRIKNSVFESNTMESSLIDGAGNGTYYNCSFINNDVASGTYLINYGSGRAEFFNNTFAGNVVPRIIQGDNRKLYNNTIVGNKVSREILSSHNTDEYTDMYGNIILGNGTSNASGIGYDNLPLVFSEKKNIQYNLMPIIRTDRQSEGADNTTWTPDNSTNIFVRPFSLGTNESTQCKACSYAYGEYEEAVLKSIFDGTYNSTTHVFSPNLDRSGDLPVIPLKVDVLSDGTSIRFPLAKTIVDADQRGEKRLDPTCMGAYEIACEPDTTLANDTIIVGGKFLDKTYTIVGRHDSIFETISGESGCDNVVMHTLIVKPDPTKKEYYVKTKRWGKGDGSSWDNAMDSVDFAACLPLAPDGATFYVAEGTYKPVYDSDLKEPTNTANLSYIINSSVTIRGGYPNDATGIDVPSEPKKYLTIFDGDIAGNDVVLKTDNEDGGFNISNEYDGDNVYELFFIKQTKDIEVSFDGVSVIHSYNGIGSYNVTPEISDKSILNIKNSTFENNYSNAIITYADDGEINIDHSTFKGNAGGVYSGHSDVTVKNSSFEGNSSANFLIGVMNGVDSENNMVSVSIDSSSFVGNVGYIQTNGSLDIRNSIFDSNIVAYSSLISTWNNYEIPNYNVNVINTKFIHNQAPSSIIETYNGETTIYYNNCIFANNTTGSYLVRSSNSIEMNHSHLSENQVKGDIFYIYPYTHLSLNSDTIENNRSEYLVRYCTSGCSIDSCKIEGNKIDQLININNSANTSTEPAIFSIKNSFITENVIQKDSVQSLIETHMRRIDTTIIYRTEIKENVTKGGSILSETHTCVNIDECFIEGNSAYDITNFVAVAGNISNSTFSNNHMLDNVISATVCAERYNPGTYIAVKNNTIVNNESEKSIFEGYYSDNLYYNNTILGNKAKKEFFGSFHGFEDPSDSYFSKFIGNIVYGNTYDREFESQQLHYTSYENSIRNNILPLLVSLDNKSNPGETQYYLFNPKNNIISDIYYEDLISDSKYVNEVTDAVNYKADIAELFQGTYDPTIGLFTPDLVNDEKSFAPVVPLKSDRLPDGTSIRFPLTETIVTTDQRGETRQNLTCMGAYELKCSDVMKTVNDTVAVGDPYSLNGNDLSALTAEVGVHTYNDTIKMESGCDSIVTLVLAVRPQKRTGGYYVKVDGTGDGSDWLNAMSPKDFATYLPLAYDNDTFHVAAGTYRCEVEDPIHGFTYCVNKDVTIIGGYPDTVKTVGTPSSPEVFMTLLTANGKSDDYMSFYLHDVLPSASGFKDNKPSLLRIIGQPNVTLFGITFSGTNNTEDGAISLKDGATLTMDRCVVSQNLSSAIYAKDADITVTNSDFSKNFSCVGSVFNVTNTKLNVQSSTIHENFSHDTLCGGAGSKGAVAYMDQSTAIFTNNTIVKNKAGEGAVFASKGSELNLTNNTITSNTIDQESTHTGSVFTFVDEQSKLKLFGNLIVANGKSSVEGSATITSSDYNIFSPDFTTAKGAHDMVMKNAEVPFILDVEELIGYDDLFSPTLRDNGGYTQTVAVFQSTFDGGEVISIPSSVRAVDLDQRGFVRKETSCVGAFEFPTYVDYYVKTRSHGDGSGRDWDNAMGDTTFARYFSIAPTNATFHIAAGTYHPMFDHWSGKISTSSSVSYNTYRPINLIGSYPADAKDGDKADATKYETILSADLKEDDEYTHIPESYSIWNVTGLSDNSSYLLRLDLRQSGACHFYGLTLKGNYPMFRGSSAALSIYSVKDNITTALYLDSCVFSKTYAGIYSNVDSLVMTSCRFDSIMSTNVGQSYRSQPYTYSFVDGCSFSSAGYALSYTIKNGLLQVQNTTINDATNPMSIDYYSWGDPGDVEINLYNNTISGRKGVMSLLMLPNFAKTVMKGNVFNTNFKFSSDENREIVPIVSDYNLYTYSPDETGTICPKGEHDLMVEPKDLVGVLEGSLEDEMFIPVDNVPSKKDLTCVVKVKNDKLSDGTVIRLPLENTVVSVDEVGQKRLPMTCMGAYELKCIPDTTTSLDTIFVGETFLGEAYTNVGRHDSIFETLQDKEDCDSVVMHTLIVMPDPSVLNYYVKTERHGTGDGSSWENAMDGTDFATCLPLAPNGATFYVAEGTYKPVYGSDLTVPAKTKSLCYRVNSDVTIRGGYPADAETGAESEPDSYQTIFSGDILGDDALEETPGENGTVSLSMNNAEDDASTLFVSYSQENQKVEFDGVYMMNAGTAICMLNPGKEVNLLNSHLKQNSTAITMPSESDVLHVYNTSFEKHSSTVLNLPSVLGVVLDSVLFDGNASTLLEAVYNGKNGGKESILMDRVNAVGNSGNFSINGYETKVTNSVFESNVASSLFNVVGVYSSVGVSVAGESLTVGKSTDFDVKNSKFIQNKGVAINNIGASSLSVDSCLFEKNDAASSSVINFYVSESRTLKIQNSEFYGNKSGKLINSYSDGNASLLNCNISENEASDYLLSFVGSAPAVHIEKNAIWGNKAVSAFYVQGESCVMANNTIASNTLSSYLIDKSGNEIQLYNNTIVGNSTEQKLTYLLGLNIKLLGNIILGNTPEEIYLNRSLVSSSSLKYNILPSVRFQDDLGYCESIKDIESDNIFSVFNSSAACDELKEISDRNEDILTTLFDGTYDPSTGLFTPKEIKNNGGFTYTLALKTDKLSDGTSIRFPLTETIVTEDQRGLKRLEQTCMGAYEITDGDCEIGTILFMEDFGGNYVSDAPRRLEALPESVNNLNYSSHLWDLGYNAYSLRKVAIKRSGAPNPEHIYTGWYAEFGDHTLESDTTRGYFMQIDLNNKESTFYVYQVNDLCENTHLYFSFWGHPVNSTNDATVSLTLKDPEGNILGQEDFVIDHTNNEWQLYGMPFDVPMGVNSVVYSVHSSAGSNGGDFALDDISIRLCKPAVNVNMPLDSICEGEDYTLTASYNNVGGYVEPVNFTWYKNTERTYELEGWEKVAEGKTLNFENLQSKDNAYYRCVISSAGVPGVFNKCNSASDIIPILVKPCVACVPDTTVLDDPDIIQVGEQFLGVTYNEAGRYDGICKVLQGSDGCDSVVKHTLIVTLNPSVKYYYVKTERHGTGDGSSWENAMDGTDFAKWLPLAPDGATFYVAEGTYKPVFGSDLSVPAKTTDLCYSIFNDVTIRGGYPADAVTGAVSDPAQYTTLFEGDIVGDDVRDDFSTNKSDNVGNLFNIAESSNTTIYGVTMQNSNRYTYGAIHVGGSLNVTNSKFYNNVTAIQSGKSIKVDSCVFERNSSCYDNSVIRTSGELVVKNSLFKGNIECDNSSCIYFSGSDMTVENSTFDSNVIKSGGYGSAVRVGSGNAVIKNSTFFNNSISNILNVSAGAVSVTGGSCDLYNNTFFSTVTDECPLINVVSATHIALVGNILSNNGAKTFVANCSDIETRNNISTDDLSENDLKVASVSDINDILDDGLTYDSRGFTPVLALKNDRLADGTSIRFLLEQTIVTKDQRGVDRLASTCMGAYEYWMTQPIECVYETVLFKEDFGGNNPEDKLYSENGLSEGLCSLPCAGNSPLAVNQFQHSGCYSLLKEAYNRQNGIYKDDHIYGGWYADFDDETYPKDLQRGYFMSIDMGESPTTFYQRRIDDLCENTNLSLSMSGRPLYAAANTVLYMSVEDLSGNPLSEITEVVIDKDINDWQEFKVTFTVPQGKSSVMFKIYSDGGHQGNDFALDDVVVRLCKARVDVNQPDGPLCKHTDYTLTASFPGDPSYLEPVNYTWFRNNVESYDLDGWEKVATGKTLEFKDMTSAINGYYRCVVSSAGVEGVVSKCSSISDVVPIFVSEYIQERDTVHINQGEMYNGVAYDKVGVFRTSAKEVNEVGCDRLTTHVIFVHPTGAEYYVTMEGRANHTGLDWDNALDSVEFATYLPLSKAGVTYHVAEGRYLPCLNYLYERSNKYCHYEVKNDVTIIGGYSKDELDETVPNNPKKYRTIFSATRSENNSMKINSVHRLYEMFIESGTDVSSSMGLFKLASAAKKVDFNGVVFNYCYGIMGDYRSTQLTLNRCSFEEMSYPVRYVNSLHVDSCYFRKLSIGSGPSSLICGVANDLIIRNTTVTDVLGGYVNMLSLSYQGVNTKSFVLENSTLVGNESENALIYFPDGVSSRIINNTIVSNTVGTNGNPIIFGFGSNNTAEFIGNLIVSNKNVDDMANISTASSQAYKYNLLGVNDDVPATNMKMIGNASSILDGWDLMGGFNPTLRDNGGYTPTLALKSDRLIDGVSIIRFPLTNTTVKADQRQYERLENTCMGAYEIPLSECTDELGLPKEHKLTYETQTITFSVPYRCDVRVIVTDLQGRLVRNADMLYRDRVGDVTVNLSDLRLFELDHDPREPFLLTVKVGGKIHVTYLYITRLDKNY